MNSLWNITLEAHHAGRNCHRWYSVSIGIDLLNDWHVCIRYGRCGRGGQERRFAGPDVNVLRRVVHHHLRRRLSAPGRIGCAYQIVAFNSGRGFDAAQWLPHDLLDKFYNC